MLKLEVIGHLGMDAQKVTGNGSEFVAFRVAHTDSYKKGDGQVVSTTTWVDVTVKPDHKVVPYLKKGTQVFVRGNAALRVYDSPQEKCWKASVSIKASEIQLLSGGQKQEQNDRREDNAPIF